MSSLDGTHALVTGGGTDLSRRIYGDAAVDIALGLDRAAVTP